MSERELTAILSASGELLDRLAHVARGAFFADVEAAFGATSMPETPHKTYFRIAAAILVELAKAPVEMPTSRELSDWWHEAIGSELVCDATDRVEARIRSRLAPIIVAMNARIDAYYRTITRQDARINELQDANDGYRKRAQEGDIERDSLAGKLMALQTELDTTKDQLQRTEFDIAEKRSRIAEREKQLMALAESLVSILNEVGYTHTPESLANEKAFKLAISDAKVVARLVRNANVARANFEEQLAKLRGATSVKA